MEIETINKGRTLVIRRSPSVYTEPGTALDYRIKGHTQIVVVTFYGPDNGIQAQDYLRSLGLQDIRDTQGKLISEGKADFHVFRPVWREVGAT